MKNCDNCEIEVPCAEDCEQCKRRGENQESQEPIEFMSCEECGKTMPKKVTGIEELDRMNPDKVWCSEYCYQEWESKCPVCEGDKALSIGPVLSGLDTLTDGQILCPKCKGTGKNPDYKEGEPGIIEKALVPCPKGCKSKRQEPAEKSDTSELDKLINCMGVGKGFRQYVTVKLLSISNDEEQRKIALELVFKACTRLEQLEVKLSPGCQPAEPVETANKIINKWPKWKQEIRCRPSLVNQEPTEKDDFVREYFKKGKADRDIIADSVIEKLCDRIEAEKGRRIHWQNIAYKGMQLVDSILDKSIMDDPTCEDDFEERYAEAWNKIDRIEAAKEPDKFIKERRELLANRNREFRQIYKKLQTRLAEIEAKARVKEQVKQLKTKYEDDQR